MSGLPAFECALPSHITALAVQQITRKSNFGSDISELLLIQQQTDLLYELIKSKGLTNKLNTFSTEVSEVSFQTGEHSQHFITSLSMIDMKKQPSRFFDQESLEEALKEIRKFCSAKTYNFVRDKFKVTEDNRKDSRLEKQKRYNQQLTRRCLKLTHQVNELKAKLEEAEKARPSLQKSTSRSQLAVMNLQKGEAFLKWEKAMLYKEKALAELKKNINKQFGALEEEIKQNNKIRNEIQQLLMKLTSCEEPSQWSLPELVGSVLNNLEQQRSLTKSQERYFQQFQNQIDAIIRQLKNAVGK